MRAFPLLFAGIVLALNCGAADQPVVTVTLADEGRTIPLKQGQSFHVVLDCTQLHWLPGSFNNAMIALTSQPAYDAKGYLANASAATWSFRTIAPGESAVVFVYVVPKTSMVPTQPSLTFNVRVEP